MVGKVTASPGVARVTVALNGREVLKQEDRKAEKRDVPFNLPVQLKDLLALFPLWPGRRPAAPPTRC